MNVATDKINILNETNPGLIIDVIELVKSLYSPTDFEKVLNDFAPVPNIFTSGIPLTYSVVAELIWSKIAKFFSSPPDFIIFAMIAIWIPKPTNIINKVVRPNIKFIFNITIIIAKISAKVEIKFGNWWEKYPSIWFMSDPNTCLIFDLLSPVKKPKGRFPIWNNIFFFKLAIKTYENLWHKIPPM